MTRYCEASLNFVGAEGPVPRMQTIYDARHITHCSIDDCGFQLVEHHSTVRDWSDTDEIDAVHYDEVTGLAKNMTGCDWVLFFPAIVRNPRQVKASADFAPIQFAHSDYTEKYYDTLLTPGQAYHKIAMQFAERAGFSESDIGDVKRVLTLQLWRNTGAESPDYPLCFGDTRSFMRDRLIPVPVDEYGGLETRFESFAIAPPAGDEYHWYTYPQLQSHEVVMFRAYDSDRVRAGLPFWTPHTAFFDPTVENAPPRQSIEMRAICLFK